MSDGRIKKLCTDKSVLWEIGRESGANVEGFDTYAYYKGNDLLRSWICTPLTVEIFSRKEETLKPFSARNYTKTACCAAFQTTPQPGTAACFLH